MLEVNGAVLHRLQLSVADIRQQYAPYTVATHFQNDDRTVSTTFTGARLWDILQTAGFEPGDNLRVMARASDRFRCLVRWHEIDPTTSNTLILVAYNQEGRPLSAKYGPLRLVVPGDERGRRSLRGLALLTVLNSKRGGNDADEEE